MQLWEFYHVTQPGILQKLAKACLSQQSATTAKQMVVYVTRLDLYGRRAKTMRAMETQNVVDHSPMDKQEKRIKNWNTYFGYIMPILYSRFFGIWGMVRKLVVWLIGIFRPIIYQVSESDMRVGIHKTCALAAQTFMLAMAECNTIPARYKDLTVSL